MASLLSLPPEIFNAVLEDVDGDDVLSLRRVDRRISALSTHQFGLKCLADLSFLCAKDSLKGLLDLIAHPLGRYIKRLTFSTHIDWTATKTEMTMLLTKITKTRPNIALESFNMPTALLVQVLENLMDLGVVPILGIYDPLIPWIALDETNAGRERRGYGFDKFYGDIKLDSNLRTMAQETVEFVLEAVGKTGYPLEVFYAHLDSQRRPKDGKSVLHHLREKFRSPVWQEPSPDIEVIHNSFNSQANLNLQAHIDTKSQNYEILTLPFPDRDWLRHPRRSLFQREDLIPGVLDMQHHFRQMRLALCDTSVEFLIDLLRSQADTLRILHLEYVTINLYDEEDEFNSNENHPDSTSLNVLLTLRDDLQLDYLRMNRVSNSRDQSRLIGGHDDSWNTREEIQDGLQMYIQREENDEHSVDEEFSDDDEGEWISVHHSDDEDEGLDVFESPWES